MAPRTRKQIQPTVGPEKAFGLALRQLRQEKGVSQEQFAFDAGLDRSYMSMVERGLRSPTMRTVLRFADTLGVPPSEIVLRMEQILSPKSRRGTS